MGFVQAPSFLLLCRSPNAATAALREALEEIGRVWVVCDRECGSPGTVWIPEKEMTGFRNLAAWEPSFPAVSAWERAWKHLARHPGLHAGGIWLVEDDVAGSREQFGLLAEETMKASVDLAAVELRSRADDCHWPHWQHAASHFECPRRSFNPLCFVSARLISATLDFRERHGCFIFHEVLFASLASQLGMSAMDWRSSPSTRNLFGEFRYRPEISEVVQGICHPVKDQRLHGQIMRPTGREITRA